MARPITFIAVAGALALAGCADKPGAGRSSGGLSGGPSARFANAAAGPLDPVLGAQLDADARRRAQEAEYQALQLGPAGIPVVWRSEAGDVYGEVVPGAPFVRDGADCRDYTHTVYRGGGTEKSAGTACRTEAGAWRAATPAG